MNILHIVWDVSPEIFQFPEWLPLIGGNGVRWYGALFAASFVVGYVIMQKIFRLENIPEKVLDELSTYMIVATVIGARLGHCFFYEPEYYLSNPIEILKIWEGGLASHGAAVGILIALYYFSRKQNKTFFWTIDRIVIVVALAGFFIRMGNLMNSEILAILPICPGAFSLFAITIPPLRATQDTPHRFMKAWCIFLLSFCFIEVILKAWHPNNQDCFLPSS